MYMYFVRGFSRVTLCSVSGSSYVTCDMNLLSKRDIVICDVTPSYVTCAMTPSYVT